MSPEIESASFQIIAAVGTARSNYIEAIDKAEQGDFDAADKLIDEGQKIFVEGHDAHFSLIQKEAAGESTEFALILMHAEDQLMSAEAFGILARKFVDVYRKMAEGQQAEAEEPAEEAPTAE